MRRQAAKSGINPAGSGRALRLDPLSLPVSFHTHDARADGSVRHVELHRERVVMRRAVRGMRMAVSIRICDFRGVALRVSEDAHMLVLLHRDPSLSVPLFVSSDPEEMEAAWLLWSDIFALPQIEDEAAHEATPRRRRHNAIRSRRPKFLVRRRSGDPLGPAKIHRDEREIIAPN